MNDTDPLDEIRKRHAAMTLGPYRWSMIVHGNGVANAHLYSGVSGHPIVMDCVRSGMNCAAPRFNRNGIMERCDRFRLSRNEGARYAMYDMDIEHPDAQGLAHSWEDIDYLLRRVEELEAELRRVRGGS